MPLHPPQASQARRSSSIALTGDGAPSRGLSIFSPAAARRMFTPHRATSNCVAFPMARIDASAKRTAAVSDFSTGKVITLADGSDMGPTRRCDSARSGRGSVNIRFGMINPPCGNEPAGGESCQRLDFWVSASASRGAVSQTASMLGFRHLARQKVRRRVASVRTRSGV